MDRGLQRSRRLAHVDPGDLEAQLRLAAAELRGQGSSQAQSLATWKDRLASVAESERFQTLTNLAKLGPTAAGMTPLFIEALQKQLPAQGDGDTPEAQGLPRPLLNQALKALEQLGAGSIGSMIASLQEVPSPIKALLLQALRSALRPELVEDETVTPLARCLEDDDPKVRYHAAELLRSLGSRAKEALPSLCFRLLDRDRNVRVTSLLAIRKIGASPHCLPMLSRALKDGDPLVRYWAARIIGELGADAVEARDALYRLLLDDDHQPRKAALAALDKINAAAHS